MPEIKETPDRGIKSDNVRQAVYIGLAALLAILTVFDVITEDVAEQIESIVLQVAALVGFSLAAANKPKRLEQPGK